MERNVGRQPQLITPENEGGDETSYPSPPKCFDDPDVPSGPSGLRNSLDLLDRLAHHQDGL